MTQEERERIVGQAALEAKENQEQLAQLKSKLRRMGEQFGALGKTLIASPETIGFAGESIEGRFHNEKYKLFDDSLLDGSKLKELVAEYKAALMREEELDKELKSLGLRPRPIEIRRPA